MTERRTSPLPSMTEISPGQRVDVIVDLIVRRIETGEYQQGDPLIARNIAQELGTSVVPVREALNRLLGEGLVELFSNRSARVKKLSPKELADSIDVWEAHAMLMVKLASQRIGIRDNAERMRAAWKKVYTAGVKGDRAKFLISVRECHKLLKEVCDNAYLDRVEKVLHTELWSRSVIDTISDDEWQGYVKGFCDVGNAVVAGDQKLAEKLYSRHIQWIVHNILRK